MDSDDNCLVIDEDVMDAEESSESSGLVIVEENNAGNNENAAVENTNGAVEKVNTANTSNTVSQPEIVAEPAKLPVRQPIPREEGTPKSSKYRYAEKSKNKDDKNRKTPISTEKKRQYHKSKAHTIRITDAVFKERVLNVTALKHQLYNMQFSYKNSILSATVPEVYPIPPVFPDVSISQLLNWPDIKMTITLEHMTIVHELKPNLERELVFGDDEMVNVSTHENPMETRHLQKVVTSKVNPMVSKEMFFTYVDALKDAAPLCEVGASKVPEIEQSFRKILDDAASIPFDSIQTRITHSRYLNKYQYVRIFDNGTKSTGGDLKVRFRETINPEVWFGIEKCCFTSDQVEVWEEEMEKYFANLFLRRNQMHCGLLRDRFKKCLTLTCERCHETFDGPLWTVKLKDHINRQHMFDKPWGCVKCRREWSQFQLLQMDWKHECTTESG